MYSRAVFSPPPPFPRPRSLARRYTRYVIYFAERALRTAPRLVVAFDMAGWRMGFSLHLGKVGALGVGAVGDEAEAPLLSRSRSARS